MQAKEGIWTPWAKVLCYPCHGPKFPSRHLSSEQMEAMDRSHPVEEGNKVTFCDECEATIQLDDSVAVEHNLVRIFRNKGLDASMAQTGGMNSACEVSTDDGGWYFITYNFDGNDGFWICRYDQEGDWIDDDEGFGTKDPDEAIAYIMSRRDIKKR